MVPLLALLSTVALCDSILTKDDIDSIDTAPKMPPTSHGEFINVGTPGGVTVDFDCAVRQYAWEYGQQIIPRHGDFVELFDALQLSACNVTRPIPKKRSPPIYTPEVSTSSCVYYVDANVGSDSNAGSVSKPFATIAKGVEASRKVRGSSSSSTPCTINLMEGTYYQDDTIQLTEADSYLTFQNYNGQRVTISGGVPLQFEGEWKLEQYEETKWQNYTNRNNVDARASQSASNDQIKFRQNMM